jgi:tetratricopeptide (TPR) repeat protein
MKRLPLYLFLFVGLYFEAQSPFIQVRTTMESANYKIAQHILDSCSKTNFHSDSTLYYKGLLSIRKGDIQGARKQCNELEKLFPEYKESHYLSGLIHFVNEKYGKSVDEFNKVLKNNPNHLKALYNRALASGLLGDYMSAIEDLSSCICLNKNYSMAYYSRAYWYEFAGKNDEAKKDYEESIRLDPKNYDAYFGLAYVYKNQKENEKACETINKAALAGSQIAEEFKESFCK